MDREGSGEPQGGAPVNRYDGVAALPQDMEPTVVTVGMFDGVHRGHRALLDRVVAEAAGRGLPAAAVTFDRHPLAVLRPGSQPPLLSTLDRKVELLGRAGMDLVLVLSFTEELSQVGAEAFATEVLFDALAARAVVVGENFRFGHKAAGDVAAAAAGTPRAAASAATRSSRARWPRWTPSNIPTVTTVGSMASGRAASPS